MLRSRKLTLALMAVGVMALTAASSVFFPTLVNVTRIGMHFTTTGNFDSLTGGQIGCETRTFLTRSTDTLFIGNVVFISARNTVGKSITIADQNKVAGVVLGGANTGNQAVSTIPDTGTLADTAAFPNQRVIVCEHGRAWVMIDSAGIAPGTAIQAATVRAGYVKAKVATLDSLNRVFGKLIDTGIVGKATVAHINVR